MNEPIFISISSTASTSAFRVYSALSAEEFPHRDSKFHDSYERGIHEGYMAKSFNRSTTIAPKKCSKVLTQRCSSNSHDEKNVDTLSHEKNFASYVETVDSRRSSRQLRTDLPQRSCRTTSLG